MVGVNKKSTFWLWIVVKDGPASNGYRIGVPKGFVGEHAIVR